jgi:hypothetical protein
MGLALPISSPIRNRITNVTRLRAFVATCEQDDVIPIYAEVNSVTGSEVDSRFGCACANRFTIPKVTGAKSGNSSVNGGRRSSIPDTAYPFAKWTAIPFFVVPDVALTGFHRRAVAFFPL